MLQISDIVKKTADMFDLFNDHFYEDALNRPAVTVSPDGGHGTYGWCSAYEIWQKDGSEAYREINICAEYIITDRLAEANERSELGHFEADTVLGKRSGDRLLTMADRMSRFTLAAKLPGESPEATRDAMIALLTHENTNGLIMEYLPKARDMTPVSDCNIAAFIRLLNLRPRKCLLGVFHLKSSFTAGLFAYKR